MLSPKDPRNSLEFGGLKTRNIQQRQLSSMFILTIAACLLTCASKLSVSAWPVPAPTFSGDLTFYNLGTQAGNCAYESTSPVGASTYHGLPFATGVSTFVALNSPQYAGTSTCGQCLVYHGTGAGSGTTPVANTPQYGMVADRCPECKKGDLDLNRPGDGRWRGSWTPVECAVGDSKFQYAFEGSNPFYLKVRVLNARVPTHTMTATVKGKPQNMTPTQDNAFLLTGGGPFSFPLSVQLTSVQGSTVKDTIPRGPTGTAQGSAQYPPTGLDKVNPTSSTGASVQAETVGSLQTCNVTLEPFSACGGINVGVGDAQIPGSCCPDGFVCVRQNRFYQQCVEEALNNNTSPSPPSPMGGEARPSSVIAPAQAPAGQAAPVLPSSVSGFGSSPIVCQLVQELLDVPSLAATCGWN